MFCDDHIFYGYYNLEGGLTHDDSSSPVLPPSANSFMLASWMEGCLRACEKLVDVRFLSTRRRHGGAADESIAASANSEGSTLIGASPPTSLCLATLAACRCRCCRDSQESSSRPSGVGFMLLYTPRRGNQTKVTFHPKRPAPSRHFARHTSCLAALNL